MAKKTEKKAPKKKPEQMKIAGTERRDAIAEIEEADETYRAKRDARMELADEEAEAQADLTNILRQRGVTEYVYEGRDGKRHRVYMPPDVKAKSQIVKEPKAPKASE